MNLKTRIQLINKTIDLLEDGEYADWIHHIQCSAQYEEIHVLIDGFKNNEADLLHVLALMNDKMMEAWAIDVADYEREMAELWS